MIKRCFGGGSVVLAFALLLQPWTTTASDVSVYAIYKRQVYIQTSPAAPVLRGCPFAFDAVVELTESNSVAAAMVGRSAEITPLEAGYIEEFLPKRAILWTTETFPDPESLERKWPNGQYTFSMFAVHDGAVTATLNLRGEYPAKPPHIRNFEETQQVDASKDFLLQWDKMDDGTTNDFSFVLIRRSKDGTPVTNTPFLGEPNALDGTVSEIIIPRGTLLPGEQYDVYVRFDKVTHRESNAYPNAVGQASFGSGTHFTLKTAP